jgi:type I restriction enzyme S subunit
VSFPRYPEYKDSGVEWLGEVPAHWEVVPMKRLLDIQNGSDHKHVEVEEGHPVYGSGGVFAFASDFLHDGDSVLLGRKGTIDRPLFVNGRFWTVDTMYWSRIRAGAVPKFAYYSALSIPFSLYSTNTALPSMTKGALNSHPVLLPTWSEQLNVVAFLDREISKIDDLVAEQQRLIALLKEKRQAVISHAVTKGLNPDVPMVDSGLPWLGDIPANWTVRRLRHLCRSVEQGWSPQCESFAADLDSEYGVLKVGAVNGGAFVPSENKKLPPDLDPLQELAIKKGDLLISRANTRELVGSAAVAEADYPRLLLCDKLYRLRFTDSAELPTFISNVLATPRARAQIEVGATGASSSMLNISQSVILDMAIAVPPSDQIEEILGFCSEVSKSLSALIAKSEAALALLSERRAALITAAVTGQIDVRGLAPAEAA